MTITATGLWGDVAGAAEALQDGLDGADGHAELAALLRGGRRVVATGNGASYYAALALWLAALETPGSAPEVVAVPGGLVAGGAGFTVTYEAVADASGSINSTSAGKTNFWDQVANLFGASPPVDTGLTGLTIYKVLVPTTKVLFNAVDDDGVPVSFLPIVKGYRKIGKSEPKEMTQPALQLYPLAVLAGYYRDEQITGTDDDPEAGIGAIKADKLQATIAIERNSSRTVQETTIWRSKEVPFGIARYDAKIIREVKDEQQSRDDFKPLSEVVISLKAQEAGEDAKSELAVP